jgi:hypothetical protein
VTILTAEIRWILACIRSVGAPPPHPTPTTLNWDRALAVAKAEGMAPALGFVFKADAPTAMPATVRERLSRHLAESTARHLVFSRELGRLLQAFGREQLPVIPLKGPVLAEMLYPHPALRPYTDLDLLIPREALISVDGLLQRLGYQRVADDHSWNFDTTYDRATLYEGPGSIHVDLHWSLLSDPRFSWNESDGLIVWKRAIEIPLGGGRASGLCPEDLLLYLAMHLAVHHGLAGLLWYWDLARLLERWGEKLDWETIVERASRWRVRTALYFALLGCERFFGPSAPHAVMSRLRARGPRAAALRWLVRRCDTEQLKRLEHLIALLLVDRTRDVIGSLTRVLFPSPAWLRARYEGAASCVLAGYLAHWRRMATIAGAATLAVARRSSLTSTLGERRPGSAVRRPS